ncbi:alpha-tocopherol transfer protein-like isoform X1 [Diabrotica virgifera virgifera]|uniref:Alpha-tocopherol transfer protein-like isoform X1 n=1 Tax=Diabrotica virgifera virgifera TaxID=50390 RepID=A0A6P7GM98_DIAVI|nr:alpha-tocopherol transfer protein-like isoform X1 [Diabrotica virgifera virgifera]
MENGVSEKVDMLKDWIKQQPHLPHKNNDVLLTRFIYCCNGSIEVAKKLIDLFYSMRLQIPELFSDRDPAHPDIDKAWQVMDLIPLPILTKDKYQLLVYRLNTSDADNFNFINAAKTFTMVADVRMIQESSLSEGEVPIFDMKNFTIKHFTKFAFPIMRKQAVYSQEALPIRLKQIHFVNATSFFDKIMLLIRPVLKSEVVKMLHVHLPNSETLFDFIPRDLLPEEYGGTIGSCEDLKKIWRTKMLDEREYFTNDEYWKVDESKRPAGSDNSHSQYFGMQGSFKTLSID